MKIILHMLGFIFGALAGKLIERQFDESLDHHFKRFNVIAVIGAIIGLTFASVVLSNTGDGRNSSGQTITSDGDDIGDNAIIAGRDVIVNNSNEPLTPTLEPDEPLPPTPEFTPNENSGPEITIARDDSETVRIGDEDFTLSISRNRDDIININISSEHASKTHYNFSQDECIIFHSIRVTYLQPNMVYEPRGFGVMLIPTLQSARFTVYPRDEATNYIDKCVNMTP